MADKWKCYKQVFKDSWIKSLKSDTNLLISDTVIPGLHLRFYHTTKKVVFYLGYKVRHTNTRRNMLVGKYRESSIKEIRDRAARFKLLISDGRDPMEDKIEERKKIEKEKNSRIKVENLLELYFEKYCKIFKKPTTQKTDRGNINKHLKPALGEFYISELNLPILIELYNKTKEQTSFSTANHVINLASSFWKWCELNNYLPINSNPCSRVPRGKDKKITIKPLELNEYKLLLGAIGKGLEGASPYNPRMFRALKLLMLTGCRTTEITKLKKANLDLDNGFIYLDDSKTGAEKKALGTPAIEEFRKAVAESPLDSEYIFPATRGGPNATLDLRKAHVWALNYAGLRHLRKHDFRHSFISVGTDRLGVPIQAVSSAVKHSNVKTTQIYSHIQDKTDLETVNRIATAIAG